MTTPDRRALRDELAARAQQRAAESFGRRLANARHQLESLAKRRARVGADLARAVDTGASSEALGAELAKVDQLQADLEAFLRSSRL